MRAAAAVFVGCCVAPGERLTDADSAALELALTTAARWGCEVLVVSVDGDGAGADAVLREALACGAARVQRLAARTDAAHVAGALAGALRGAAVVWCGDLGPAGGSGAVPAFLAAELGIVGAFGLVDVSIGGPAESVAALRRLDGGRRERLSIDLPAVLSVEGAVARLRRASLPGVLRAERASIYVEAGASPAGDGRVSVGRVRPYRPRPRAVPPPAGSTALERVRALTGLRDGTAEGARRAPVRADDPEQAADLILEALASWGYELPDRASS